MDFPLIMQVFLIFLMEYNFRPKYRPSNSGLQFERCLKCRFCHIRNVVWIAEWKSIWFCTDVQVVSTLQCIWQYPLMCNFQPTLRGSLVFSPKKQFRSPLGRSMCDVLSQMGLQFGSAFGVPIRSPQECGWDVVFFIPLLNSPRYQACFDQTKKFIFPSTFPLTTMG